MRASKPGISLVQPRLGSSSRTSRPLSNKNAQISGSIRNNSLGGFSNHSQLQLNATVPPRPIAQQDQTMAGWKSLDLQTSQLATVSDNNLPQIEAQSTMDRSPMRQTPKPPRPEKVTILSQDSSTYQPPQARSNQRMSDKDKILSIKRAEQVVNAAAHFEASTSSINGGAGPFKPSMSQLSQSSGRRADLSTYISPKVKTSSSRNAANLNSGGKTMPTGTSTQHQYQHHHQYASIQLTPRNQVSQRKLILQSLGDEESGHGNSEEYELRQYQTQSRGETSKAKTQVNSQLGGEVSGAHSLNDISMVASSQKSSQQAQQTLKQRTQKNVVPRSKKSAEKTVSSSTTKTANSNNVRKSTRQTAQPAQKEKVPSSIKQKVVQQQSLMKTSRASQANLTRNASMSKDASIHKTTTTGGLNNSRRRSTARLEPSEMLASVNKTTVEQPVGRDSQTQSASRMYALQKNSSRYIKAQQSKPLTESSARQSMSKENNSSSRVKLVIHKKVTKVQTTVQRAKIDLQLNGPPTNQLPQRRERSMSGKAQPLNERLNRVSETTPQAAPRSARDSKTNLAQKSKLPVQRQSSKSKLTSNLRPSKTQTDFEESPPLNDFDEPPFRATPEQRILDAQSTAQDRPTHSRNNSSLRQSRTEMPGSRIAILDSGLDSSQEMDENKRNLQKQASPQKTHMNSAKKVKQKTSKNSTIGSKMQMYQTCNLSSSSARARDFNASMMSSQSTRGLHGHPGAGIDSMKHQVKLLTLDLSKNNSQAPQQNRPHYRANQNHTQDDSGDILDESNQDVEEETKQQQQSPFGRHKKSHINAVSRDQLVMNTTREGKMRSLSQIGAGQGGQNHNHSTLFLRPGLGSQGGGDHQSTSMTLLKRSPRNGLMPSTSQPNQLQQIDSQIDDLSHYRNMLAQQEKMLQEQKRNIQQRLVAYDKQLSLKQTLKKKIKPFTRKPEETPMEIFVLLTAYDGGLVKKFSQLCKGFRRHILFEFKSQMQPAIRAFKKVYGDYFEFKSVRLWENKISFGGQEGTRVDQVIRFRVKSECSRQSMIFGCSGDRYETTRKKRLQNVAYKFDCFGQGQTRWQWVHKEEREFHGPSDVRSYSIPVIPICAEDYVEISVTIMSLMGVLDISTLEWKPCIFEQLPEQEDIRNYNRLKSMTPDRDKLEKYFADLKRVCEVEDTVVEWFDKSVHQQICQNSLKDHLKRQIDDFLTQLERQFDAVQIEVGGIDFSVWKIHLQAKAQPETQDAVLYPDLNIELRVIPSNTVEQAERLIGLEDETDLEDDARPLVALTNEVKKVGVIIDRGQCMEFRAGDELIIYVSMGGFEK